jgi:hypothetical protein
MKVIFHSGIVHRQRYYNLIYLQIRKSIGMNPRKALDPNSAQRVGNLPEDLNPCTPSS